MGLISRVSSRTYRSAMISRLSKAYRPLSTALRRRQNDAPKFVTKIQDIESSFQEKVDLLDSKITGPVPDLGLNDEQFTFFKLNSGKHGNRVFKAVLEKAEFTYPKSKGIEITVDLAQLSEEEQNFAKKHFYQYLAHDDQNRQLLVTYSDQSFHQVNNRKLAIDAMSNLINQIETLDPKFAKKFQPFVDRAAYEQLDPEWKNSAYVKYGPTITDMKEAFGWEIQPGVPAHNSVVRDWHDNRPQSEIEREAQEILKQTNHRKRFLKKTDALPEPRLYPVVLQQQ